MAVVSGSRSSRGRVRTVAWCVAALGLVSAASSATFACINFDGLDSADPDSGLAPGVDGNGSSGFEGSAPGCEAGIQSDPFNCGACGHICAIRVNSIPSCTAGACGLACNTSFGNCDKNDDNGCETPLFSDPKNCGGCGRDCAGGGCTNGQCQPITLATGQSYPQTIVLDQSTVYWGSLYSYTVDKIPKDGGTSTILTQNEVYPSGIALDATYLYWVDRGYGSADGLVRKLPLAGGAPSTLVSGLSSRPTAIVVAGSEIFYATTGSGSGLDGTVVRVPVTNVPDAGAGSVVATAQSGPTSMAADATAVYWTNAGTNVAPDAGGPNGTVMKCLLPACAGGPQAVAAGQNHPRGIAVDADSIYWTNYGTGQNDGAVLKCAKSSAGALDGGGAPVTTLATGLLYPDAVTVDAKYAYFTTHTGLIEKVALQGGTPAENVVQVVQSYPFALATDDQFLYFATPNGPAGGSIQKLLK
jgi:hypothetical protein